MILIIRADAGAAMGTGHVMRCLALAQAWKDSGGEVIFITSCRNPALLQRLGREVSAVVQVEKPCPDLSDHEATVRVLRENPGAPVVLDGYHFTPEYQGQIREKAYRLLVIDDLAHLDRYHADLILNQNSYAAELAYPCDANTKLLLGTEYVLLRREFWPWQGWRRRIPETARHVLITMGGSDPENVSLKILQALERVAIDGLQATVVVGGSNVHLPALKKAAAHSRHAVQIEQNTERMPELMARADLAVAAGGTTCWELMYMGVPTLSVIISDNQVRLVESLACIGAIANLGWFDQLSDQTLAAQIADTMRSFQRRLAYMEKGRNLVDGSGAKRVLQALQEEPLMLRPVRESDSHLLWLWANDPQTRAASFSSGYIPWEEHQAWFAQNLADPDSFSYIAVNASNTPVGLIRFKKSNGDAVASLVIAPEHRGRGYGRAVIALGLKELSQAAEIKAIHAYIKPANTASVRAFSRAGFSLQGENEVRQQRAYHYLWRRNVQDDQY